MNNVRRLLDAEIGTPPPSRLDIEKIMTTQRRRTALRRSGTGLSITAFAIMIAVLASTLTFADRPAKAPGFAAGGQPTSAPQTPGEHDEAPSVKSPAAGEPATNTSPADSRVMPPAVSRVDDPDYQAKAGQILEDFLHTALPDAHLGKWDVPNTAWGGGLKARIFGRGTAFMTGAAINDAAGREAIEIIVDDPQDGAQVKRGCLINAEPSGMSVDCQIKDGPGGSKIEILRRTLGDYQNQAVRILYPDGTNVEVDLCNSLYPYKAERVGLNLTMDQLESLATNPELIP